MTSDRLVTTAPTGCTVRCVGFDFEHKRETDLALDQVATALDGGTFVWIDVELSEPQGARTFLMSLALLSDETIDDILSAEPMTQLARFEDYVSFALSGCTPLGAGGFEVDRTDCALGANFLFTLHRRPAAFIDRMRRHYHQEFTRFARTPSFLIYQLWDQLVESYVAVQRSLETQVAALHTELMRPDDDEDVFDRVGKLGIDLLRFRRVVVPARSVVRDLGTRRSLFLSDLTQANLQNLGGVLDHVLQELVIDREILSESLALHESVVSHRTNAVMKKLTVVSVVFLPLTFLCGVYGMNFQHLPELAWRYGYAYFWAAVVTVVLAIAWFSRRARLW